MRGFLFVLVAIALGFGAGEYLTQSLAFRRWIGHVVRQGNLEALVGCAGIYDRDIDRAWSNELFANGSDSNEIAPAVETAEKAELLQRLVAEEKLNAAAAGQPLERGSIAREIELLRWQFPDEKSWNKSLDRAAAHPWLLRRESARNLRVRVWLEKQIAAEGQPNDSKCRAYFAAHPEEFSEPLRLRASQLFLAAPDGYPAAVIESKQALINALAKRLANGEEFAALVAEFSEDEATKTIGGDLNYFAAERMLPEVFEAAKALRPGHTSGPLRSRLGFHLLRLTDSRPPRVLSFEEAQPEIAARLENARRLAVLGHAKQ